MKNKKEAIIILEDGKSFHGSAFGSTGETIGEVCFNTGMSGYQEILTDPSYAKQIVAMTFPHIGNYGINHEDIESPQVQVAGFVIKEESLFPSNWRSIMSLGDYLREQNIVGIKNVDTRSLTRYIRDHGAMNAIISSNILDKKILEEKLKRLPPMEGLDLAKTV